jgi:hypothetical protein
MPAVEFDIDTMLALMTARDHLRDEAARIAEGRDGAVLQLHLLHLEGLLADMRRLMRDELRNALTPKPVMHPVPA